jgi:hypothetical protein
MQVAVAVAVTQVVQVQVVQGAEVLEYIMALQILELPIVAVEAEVRTLQD